MLKFVSLVFWSGLYFKSNTVWPEKNPEWSSRVVTMLHGTVATIMGLYLCGTPSLARCTEKIGVLHRTLMIWSWGYFSFDLIWCLVYWPHNLLMLAHHACALCGISMYMGKTYSGCTFPCSLAFMEITNPLLQLRWFLRDSGHDKTKLFLAVEVMYLTLFLGLRAVAGSYLIIKILDTDTFRMEEKLLSLLLYIVSMAFVYEIVGYVLYKYKTKVEEFQGFLVEMGIILNDQI